MSTPLALKHEIALSPTKREELVKMLNEYIQYKSLSWNKIATMMSLSPATLNQWKYGKYLGDVVTIESKVMQFLAFTEKREEIVNDEPFIFTEAAKIALEALDVAYKRHKMIALTGKAGRGKTTAIKHYMQHNPETALITVTPVYRSTFKLVRKVAGVLGTSIRNDSGMIEDRIITYLKSKPKLLIFDEVQRLTRTTTGYYDALEEIRSIHDLSGCGVVLSGAPEFIDRIISGMRECDQIYSRITIRRNLPDLDQADATKFTNYYCPGIPQEMSNLAWDYSKGSVRQLTELLENVSGMSGGKITKKILDLANKNMTMK